ncbi:Hypothetical_protein [Hexamita inflata]|uniref:Hypothetical_protein n=1 Tax=Hexamita inflata TaxID=28002 RepID=A0AA86RIA2_9EUKA|nr:Hypothetical protein HINF_LOCUS62938 [Hexamita inflata]
MTHHRQASPMEIFIMPICYRIAAWIWPALLVTCITLIIVQVSSGADEDILIGAAFAGFLCFITVMISATACCSVGSVKYIQLPCCISQSEVELIKQDCMMRSPNFMMTAAIMSGVQPSILGMQPNMVVQMQPQIMVPQNQVIQNSAYSINQQIPGVQLSSITSLV